MLDLASIDGAVALSERPVAPHEVGQPLSAITTGLGLRIYRQGGKIRFDSPEARNLQPGDTIVEVVTR